MAHLDFIDFNSMIVGLIAICVLILIVYKKLEFRKYVPGLMCIITVLIAEVFESGSWDVFEIMENVGILLGAALLLIAALLEYYESNPKRNENK